MDRSSIVGIGLGLIILAAAMALGHVPIKTLLNPEALLIVFGGTLTTTLVGFNQRTIMNALKALSTSTPEGRLPLNDAVTYVMDVVLFIRDEGILAIQPMLETIELPFFRKGLMLVLDNRPEKFIRDSLSTEVEVVYRENMDYARVFETAGGFAPTMGIIGAVIGLIHVVQAFKDPAQLGQGVANAFSATLYGVALSNLFLLPLAAKLRQRAKDEWYIRTLLIESILSIRAGEHPMLIEERLNAFQSPSARQDEFLTIRKKPHASAPNPQILPSRAVMDDDFLHVSSHYE